MSNFTTELVKNLSNNVPVEEIFRAELEKAFNQLLETELLSAIFFRLLDT